MPVPARSNVPILERPSGVGIGRAHYKRRVHTHLVAMNAFIDGAARDGARLLDLVRRVRSEVAQSAGSGDLIVQTTGAQAHTFGAGKAGHLAFLGRIAPDKGLHTAVAVARRSGMRLVPGRVHHIRAEICHHSSSHESERAGEVEDAAGLEELQGSVQTFLVRAPARE